MHRFGADGLKPITELHPGQRGIIKAIQGDQRVVQRLSDLGLLPGTSILITNIAPLNGPLEVIVRGTKLAIGRKIAKSLFVDVEDV